MTSKITKILLILLPYVVANHYTFTNIGFGVFSSDVANLAIPIDVLQLKPVMVDLQKLIKQLQKATKDHAAHQFVGPMLSSLAATATERYLTQENKYHNVIHFFTKHWKKMVSMSTEAMLIKIPVKAKYGLCQSTSKIVTGFCYALI